MHSLKTMQSSTKYLRTVPASSGAGFGFLSRIACERQSAYSSRTSCMCLASGRDVFVCDAQPEREVEFIKCQRRADLRTSLELELELVGHSCMADIDRIVGTLGNVS